MSQPARTETLERFRNNEARLLVASDVAARGLDIQGLSHVFNFDVPIHAEDYVHRIGRTGRAGREGRAFTLAAPHDGKFVSAIEKLIGKAIPRAAVENAPSIELSDEERPDRREREPRNQRGGRNRRGNRKPDPQHAARAAEASEPVQAQTPQQQPAPHQEERRRDDHRKDERRQRDERPARETQGNDQRRNRRGNDRRSRHQDDSDEPTGNVVAFGDNVPAFLRIPVPVSRKAS
jgi:superfamily II DNA/RNA helicase